MYTQPQSLCTQHIHIYGLYYSMVVTQIQIPNLDLSIFKLQAMIKLLTEHILTQHCPADISTQPLFQHPLPLPQNFTSIILISPKIFLFSKITRKPSYTLRSYALGTKLFNLYFLDISWTHSSLFLTDFSRYLLLLARLTAISL